MISKIKTNKSRALFPRMNRDLNSPAPPQDEENIYNRIFWLAYTANVALVCANSLTYRFAEMVADLGGTEKTAGLIVAVGLFASLTTRFFLGTAIDRFGAHSMWIAFSALFTAGCATFLLPIGLSWTIYAARIAFAVGLAGLFTCSMVHIQNQVPHHRRTEIIGNLGTSGFIGMVAGTQLGDVIFHALPHGRPQFTALFGGATALAVFYFSLVIYLTRHDVHERPTDTPAVHQLMFRYWPGLVLLVAMMMGTGITVITVFLTRFATFRGLGGIGTFFTGYAFAAFIVRIVTRDWSRTVGRHAMILMGLGGLMLGYFMLPFVTSSWQFLFPAVTCGFGHALLFPAVVSLAAGAFPRKYRGTGTTVVLGFFDLGTALSAPLLGSIIDAFNPPGFVPMFLVSAAAALVVAVIYAVFEARYPERDYIEDAELDDELPLPGERILAGQTNEAEPTLPETVPFPHVGRT